MMLQGMELKKDVICDINEFHKKYPLYSGPRPVAAAKRADLRSLAEHLPEAKRQQYYDLITDEATLDSDNELEDMTDVIAEVCDGDESSGVLMIGN